MWLPSWILGGQQIPSFKEDLLDTTNSKHFEVLCPTGKRSSQEDENISANQRLSWPSLITVRTTRYNYN
jgi:hypothetical protein